MAAAILLAFASLGLIRTGGFTAGMQHDFSWRWTTTPEERLLAAEPEPVAAPPAAPAATPAAPSPAPATPTPTAAVSVPTATPAAAMAPPPASPAPTAVAIPRPEWPGFRGAERDGVVSGTRIATDWSATPPVALWKRAVGPGWSSFAVAGDGIYTQEQRGEDELVACYSASTDAPIWQHRDRARFWESNGGAGPRGTPLLHQGRVYAVGATGIVNALDAATGAVLWSRNAASDTGAKVPMWGFSGSPVIVDDLLIVPTSGALAAYDAATGQPRWKRAPQGEGYSSPQLVTLGGVRQVVFVHGEGITGVALSDGAVLWTNAWKGYRVVQPAMTADGDLLFNGQGGPRPAAPLGCPQRVGVDGDGALGRPGASSRTSTTSSSTRATPTASTATSSPASTWPTVPASGRAAGPATGSSCCSPIRTRCWWWAEEGDIALVKAAPDGFAELGRLTGDRRQDLEPPGGRRRSALRAERRADGGVPAPPPRRGPL